MHEIEEREAAGFNGYTWEQWMALPRENRVDCIAYFRVKTAIEAHKQDAQNEEIQRRSRIRSVKK